MPRSLSITLRPETSDSLIAECRQIPGVIGILLHRGASVQPPGDVVGIEITDRALPDLMRLLDRYGLGRDDGLSMVTNQPVAVVSTTCSRDVDRDTNMATWEEMELAMGRESNTTTVTMTIMFISGALATVGIANNTLHLVVGAMVIAPGFEPLVRIGQGLLVRAVSWRYGLTDAFLGYLSLFCGAVATSLLFKATDTPLTGEQSTYLPPKALINFWTSISWPDFFVSGMAGVAGAALIATHRAVLTAGVMIALALIPSLAVAGMGVVQTDLTLFTKGMMRWGIDVVLVMVTSLALFAWKRWRVDRRTAVP